MTAALAPGVIVAPKIPLPNQQCVTIAVVSADGRCVTSDVELSALTTERGQVGVMVGGAVVSELVDEVTK